MIRFSTSSKSLWIVGLLVFAFVAVQGCSGEQPKTGQKIQQGDYVNAPGGGGKTK